MTFSLCLIALFPLFGRVGVTPEAPLHHDEILISQEANVFLGGGEPLLWRVLVIVVVAEIVVVHSQHVLLAFELARPGPVHLREIVRVHLKVLESVGVPPVDVVPYQRLIALSGYPLGFRASLIDLGVELFREPLLRRVAHFVLLRTFRFVVITATFTVVLLNSVYPRHRKFSQVRALSRLRYALCK